MELSQLTWPMVEALARDKAVVLPIASMEQHSLHLPLFTDSLLLGEIVRRVESKLQKEVLFAPVMWMGNSHHHLEFPGTITASPRLYIDLLNDMVECMLIHGFRRVVLLNGHGGNSVPAQQALFEIRQRHRNRKDLLLLSANYWELGRDPREMIPGLTQARIQHACQWETSMMLCLRPDLVGELSGLEPVDYGRPFQPAHRASIMRDITEPGHVGDPGSATAEIGKALFEIYSEDVRAFLRRVSDWDGASWSG